PRKSLVPSQRRVAIDIATGFSLGTRSRASSALRACAFRRRPSGCSAIDSRFLICCSNCSRFTVALPVERPEVARGEGRQGVGFSGGHPIPASERGIRFEARAPGRLKQNAPPGGGVERRTACRAWA